MQEEEQSDAASRNNHEPSPRGQGLWLSSHDCLGLDEKDEKEKSREVRDEISRFYQCK